MSKLKILAPISLGELIDKLTILNIKLDKVINPEQRHNIRVEHDELNALLDLYRKTGNGRLKNYETELQAVNEEIWNLEDDIRELTSMQNYGEQYITTARNIHECNDRRARIKKEVNIEFNSGIVEEKLYKE